VTAEAPAKRIQWSHEDVRKALVAEAVTGSSERASDLTGVPPSTIRDWKLYQHHELYEKIREEVLPQVGKQLAHEANDAIRLSIQNVRTTAEKLATKLEQEDVSATDLSTIGRNSAVQGSVLNDKIVGPNLGRPTAVIEHRSVHAFINEHKQFVIDADVVDEDSTTDPSADELTSESDTANARAQLQAAG